MNDLDIFAHFNNIEASSKEEGWSRFVRGNGSSAAALAKNLSKGKYIVIEDSKFRDDDIVLLRRTDLNNLKRVSEMAERINKCDNAIRKITEGFAHAQNQ